MLSNKARTELLHQIHKEDQIIFLDPKDEYENIIKATGGNIIYLKDIPATSIRFNPIGIDEVTPEAMAEKEGKLRKMMEHIKEKNGTSYASMVAGSFLGVAEVQKESLPEGWFERVLKLFTEYL